MLHVLSDSVFPAVLRMSLYGAAAVIVVLLVRLLLRRAPKVFSYALWLVVLFRLLCHGDGPAGPAVLAHFRIPGGTLKKAGCPCGTARFSLPKKNCCAQNGRLAASAYERVNVMVTGLWSE